MCGCSGKYRDKSLQLARELALRTQVANRSAPPVTNVRTTTVNRTKAKQVPIRRTVAAPAVRITVRRTVAARSAVRPIRKRR